MDNWKKIPFVILLLLLLISCATPTTTPKRTYLDNSSIYRYTDDEAGVVCWVSTMYGGISCLPISETRLESRE